MIFNKSNSKIKTERIVDHLMAEAAACSIDFVVVVGKDLKKIMVASFVEFVAVAAGRCFVGYHPNLTSYYQMSQYHHLGKMRTDN